MVGVGARVVRGWFGSISVAGLPQGQGGKPGGRSRRRCPASARRPELGGGRCFGRPQAQGRYMWPIRTLCVARTVRVVAPIYSSLLRYTRLCTVRMHSRECHKSRPGWGLRDAPAETCIGVDFRDASGTDCPESLSANVRR